MLDYTPYFHHTVLQLYYTIALVYNVEHTHTHTHDHCMSRQYLSRCAAIIGRIESVADPSLETSNDVIC